MPSQKENAEQVALLSAHFPKRLDPSYAWGQAIGGFLFTQNLRALWSGSSVDENYSLFDHSGQGRTLTSFIPPVPGGYGLVAYEDFHRAGVMGPEYLSRATEPGLEFEGDMAIWTWARFDAPSTGVITGLLSKWWGGGGANERSYRLYKTAADLLTFEISSLGTAASVVTIAAPASAYQQDKWIFLAGRFTVSTELALFVGYANNGTYSFYRLLAGVPMFIYVGTEPFYVGMTDRGNNFDGKLSLFGAANAALPDVYIWNMFSQTRPLFMNW